MKKRELSLVAIFLLSLHLYAQEAAKLGEVKVISATKTEQSLSDVSANVDVITAEDIEARKYKSVLEALSSISGINVSQSGGIGQQTSVFLRGMDSKKTLVLIDGIRYNDPSGNGANFEHLMINDIERIEVIKGAQSSIWGADASAGVINIITKSAQSGTHTNVSFESGRYGSKIARANISHKNENFDAKLGVTRVNVDGFSVMSPKSSEAKKYEKDGYKNTTANLKLGYNFDENNRVSTSYEMIDSKTDIDGYDSFYNMDPNVEDRAKTKTHLANLTYENKNDIATTKVYANYTDIKREYTSSTPKYKGTIKEYGANTNIEYLSSSNLLLGADYKKFENGANINKHYDNKAIFFSNTNKFFNGKTIISEALRYDKYSDFENKTTGKIGLKQYVLEDLNISSNYGAGYNIPTTFELYDAFYGNPNLKPEKTETFDIGVSYKGFLATYFNSKVKNLIDWNGIYNNVDGKSRFKGIELAYKNSITEDIFLNLNYTRLSAKNKDKKELGRRAKDRFVFSADYYGLRNFHFNINGEYVGKRYDFNDKKGAKTGNYTIWGGVVDYDINKNLSTYVKLDNIFNKDYQVVDGYATAQRAFYAGLKVEF